MKKIIVAMLIGIMIGSVGCTQQNNAVKAEDDGFLKLLATDHKPVGGSVRKYLDTQSGVSVYIMTDIHGRIAISAVKP